MRPRYVLCALVLLGGLLGCATAPRQSSPWFDRFHQDAEPSGPDVMVLDVFSLECPFGAPYINQALWTAIDEQIVEFEVKATLDDNGFRVGLLGGVLPGDLQSLLSSERTCPSPRRFESHAGKLTSLPLGQRLERTQFTLQQGGKSQPMAFENAQWAFEVAATPGDEGHVRLKVVPTIEHGEGRTKLKPAADRSGWMYAHDQPTERLTSVGWEVQVAPNEFVVIGGRFDRPGTAGHQAFLRGAEQPPCQRLLVLRARMQSEREVPAQAAGAGPPRSPTLAWQATRSVVRATTP
jgi:hypothetical protein